MHLDQYREKNKEKLGAAYSKTNPALKILGISFQHFGMICKGIRRPGPSLSLKLVEWSGGEITLQDLYQFYEDPSSFSSQEMPISMPKSGPVELNELEVQCG